MWESFVKTGQARAEIRRFLRSKKRDEFLNFGRNIVNQVFMQNGKELDEQLITSSLEEFRKKTLEDLYIAIGEGGITRGEVIKKLFPETLDSKNPEMEVSDEFKVSLKGLTKDVSITYASCCNPLPGERIVGIQNPGGVTVHRAECKTLQEFVDQPEKWLDIRWDEASTQGEYLCRLDVVVKNRRGTMAEISRICADNEANIYNMRIFADKGQDFCKITLDLELSGATHLSRMEYALKASELVSSVKRHVS